MRKIGVSFILSFIFASFNVFALTPQEIVEKVPEWVAQVLKFLFVDFKLDPENETGFLFAKLVLFVVLISIFYAAAKKLPLLEDKSFISFLVAFGITVLGLQFADKDLLAAMLLPAGAVAITLSVLVPIALAGVFISSINVSAVRKIGWTLLFIAFVGLAFIRSGDLGDLLWIYVVAAVLSIVLFIFDGVFHRLWTKFNVERFRGEVVDKEIQIKRSELAKLEGALANATTPQDIKSVRSQIANVRKQISEMVKEKEK